MFTLPQMHCEAKATTTPRLPAFCTASKQYLLTCPNPEPSRRMPLKPFSTYQSMTAAAKPGWNLTRATLSLKSGFKTSLRLGSRFVYSSVNIDTLCSLFKGEGVDSASTSAIGVALIDLKVSLRLVWHLGLFVPLWTAMAVSETVSCIASTTS